MSGAVVRYGHRGRCQACQSRPPSQKYPDGTIWKCSHCLTNWIVLDKRSDTNLPYAYGRTWYRKKWYHR